jgi:copper chaperone CopZ
LALKEKICAAIASRKNLWIFPKLLNLNQEWGRGKSGIRGETMKKISLNVQKEFCAECSLALRRYIGKMNGVESIDVASGGIEIDFDETKVKEEDLRRISKESVEKLGYKIFDDE